MCVCVCVVRVGVCVYVPTYVCVCFHDPFAAGFFGGGADMSMFLFLDR